MYVPGGYAILVNGIEYYSTIGSGWSGAWQRLHNIGSECAPLVGRCCYGSNGAQCVDQTTDVDCLSTYDGCCWEAGLNCVDHPCDYCDYSVTAPYTSPARSTCGGFDRCDPGPCQNHNTSADHVYCVEIPYAGTWSFNTCRLDSGLRTILSVGTSVCSGDLGCDEDACSNRRSEVVVYLAAGQYYCTIEGPNACADYILDIRELPCPHCPEGGVPETEPCGDDTNGGCDMDPPAFEPIACGETVCGTGWRDWDSADADWFEFTAVANETMTWTVNADFRVSVGLLEQFVPGQAGCENLTGFVNPQADAGRCEQISVTFPVTAGGTYYLLVMPQDGPDVDCGTMDAYTATLTGVICSCGDLDADLDCDMRDYAVFLAAFGTCSGEPAYVPAADLDGDACVTLADYQAWLECFRTANPGAAAPGLSGLTEILDPYEDDSN